MRCHIHAVETRHVEEFLEHILEHHLNRLELLMSEMNDDQKHLEADVAALRDSFAAEVAALKAQIAANPTVMAAHLDFTSLDGLVGETTTAASTVTPALVPSDHPSLATEQPLAAPIGQTSPSPFADPETADEAQDGDADEDDQTKPDVTSTSSDLAAPAAPAAGQDASSVLDPGAASTPTTEPTPAAPADEA